MLLSTYMFIAVSFSTIDCTRKCAIPKASTYLYNQGTPGLHHMQEDHWAWRSPVGQWEILLECIRQPPQLHSSAPTMDPFLPPTHGPAQERATASLMVWHCHQREEGFWEEEIQELTPAMLAAMKCLELHSLILLSMVKLCFFCQRIEGKQTFSFLLNHSRNWF